MAAGDQRQIYGPEAKKLMRILTLEKIKLVLTNQHLRRDPAGISFPQARRPLLDLDWMSGILPF